MIREFSNKLHRLFRLIYEPLCRTYAKLSMPRDEPADKLMTLLVAIEFLQTHRYWPRFKKPRSFSEKVCSRMLYDRDPNWTLLTDKLSLRKYIENSGRSEYLTHLLWTGDKPEAIPHDQLPSRYVIKTNHGCGYNIIVMDNLRMDNAKVALQLRKWLKENFCTDRSLGVEWHYKNIEPQILIEEFLDDNGKPPLDYKFFCFSGRVEYVLVTFDRHSDPFEKHFTRDFFPLDLWNGCRQYPGKVERPKNYEEMLALAESISQGFDFIRVDLYNLQGRIYFGELTCSPAGGLARFIPRDYDFVFGERWKTGGKNIRLVPGKRGCAE